MAKRGKTIRVTDQALTMIRDLRATMEHASEFAGMKINPVVKLNDGIVISWALALANMVMNPKCALIDREVFLETLDRELVNHFAALNVANQEERRAMLEMLAAACSEFSAFDTSAPLRAQKPEGRPS